ncbi:MAG: hypothetical protein JW809_19435 [Pirellulales bacterium]|nr:hypothetical protein [Pirellulales bacterium]
MDANTLTVRCAVEGGETWELYRSILVRAHDRLRETEATSPDTPSALSVDPELTAHAQTLAGKLNFDFQKILEIVLMILQAWLAKDAPPAPEAT